MQTTKAEFSKDISTVVLSLISLAKDVGAIFRFGDGILAEGKICSA